MAIVCLCTIHHTRVSGSFASEVCHRCTQTALSGHSRMGEARDTADFEDDRALLAKESRLRKKTLLVYNKRREDFDSDLAFNDYKEEVEDIVFNLANEVNVEETKAKVEQYRRANLEETSQITVRNHEEERRKIVELTTADRDYAQKLKILRKRDAEHEEDLRRKRRELEEEEMQRVVLGDAEADRLKRKKEKKARKQRQKQEREELAKAQALAKASEVDTRPMFSRPVFPNPPPKPILVENQEQGAVDGASRAAAGGFSQALVNERALREFDEAISFVAAR